MIDRLSGLGLSAAPREAVAQCKRKCDASPRAWGRLDYLSVGVSSRDDIPGDLVAAMREAQLATAVHLLELNLVRPLAAQQVAVDALLRKVEALEPVCVEEDVGLWSWGATELESHMLPPVFDDEAVEIVAANVAALQRLFGVPFYAENPPIYFDLGPLDVLAFMERVAEASGCGLVLDIGHLVGYCAISGREPDEYLAAWQGIHHVRELHIAGFTLSPDVARPFWFDDHSEPIGDYSIELAALACARAGRSLPITLEQEGAKIVRVADHITRVSRRLFS
jgi:uncharacterized protein (UPF0276 family)